MRRYVQGLVILLLAAVAVTASCRRNSPSLVDTNQAPDTELWYAPPDSTDYEYIVHMYWRGTDNDGVADKFIWTITDTLVTDDTRWNPAIRLADFQSGHITSRTDSLYSFTAFKDIAGVGVRKNRQAFYVAAIDNNGIIDPSPAAVEFIATIDRLPEMRFMTHVNGRANYYVSSKSPPADTVGMFKPFQISYHGLTTNGMVRGYEFFPLNSTVTLPGANVWTEDLSDTLRSFPNTVVDALPAGVFRFAARCIDDANAESQVDAGQFRRGVCQVVVNFDPDTRITNVLNTWFRAGVPDTMTINFRDSKPDTVPFKSWIRYSYNAWDNPVAAPDRDIKVKSPSLDGTAATAITPDLDLCIDFQVKYIRNSARVAGAFEDSGWLPRNGLHDSDPNSATDSNTVAIGSLEYQWFVRAVDENGGGDGTPPYITIIGNFDPTLDSAGLRDHLGNQVNIATIDTLTWNFYKGIGWPYTAETDTFDSVTRKYVKRYGWTLSGTGHDDSRDPPGSALKAWRYFVYTDYNASTNSGTFWPLGRAGNSWFPGVANNVMSDTFTLTVRYEDPQGADVFANQPGYFNNLVTIVLYGRDLGNDAGDFAQNVYWNDDFPVDPTPKDDFCVAAAKPGSAAKHLVNSFNTGSLGRWTPRKVIQFYLKFER